MAPLAAAQAVVSQAAALRFGQIIGNVSARQLGTVADKATTGAVVYEPIGDANIKRAVDLQVTELKESAEKNENNDLPKTTA